MITNNILFIQRHILDHIVFSLTAVKMPHSVGSNGGSISNYHLIKYLSEHANVDVVCPSCNFSNDNDLNKTRFKVIRQASIKGARGRFMFQVKLLFVLFRLSSKAYFSGKELTLVSNTVTIPCTYLISKLFNMKHIILCRAYEEFFFGTYNPVSYSKYYTILRRLVNLSVTRRAYDNSILITNSNWMISAIKKSFEVKKEVELLYPPVDLDFSLKKKITSSIKIIGFINSGALKGHSIVLSLAAMLPALTFHIYGDNKVFSSNILLPKNIILLGWVNSKVIYKNIDLLLVPSSWPEPFGRVSIEAQGMGIPVLVSNFGGLPETVISNDFIVKNNTVNEWLKSYYLICGNYHYYLSELYEKTEELKKFDLKEHNKKLDKIFLGDFKR